MNGGGGVGGSRRDDEEDEEEEQEERWLHLCLLPSECEGQSTSKLYPEPYILILKPYILKSYKP